jgi:hypothetical protein
VTIKSSIEKRKTLTLHTLTLQVYYNPRVAYLRLPADRVGDLRQYVRQL